MKLTRQLQFLVLGATITSGLSIGAVLSLVIPATLLPLEQNRQQEELARQRLRFQSSVQNLRSDVLVAANLAYSPQLLRELHHSTVLPSAGEHLASTFEALMRAKPDFVQLRVLGNAPPHMELLRIERTQAGSPIFRRGVNELQPKGDRPYVITGSTLSPGEVHFSALSLNQEHGRVQLPQLPVVRAVTPLCDEMGACPALVVVNADMGPLLEQLRAVKGLRILGLDGNFWLHENRALEFASDAASDVDTRQIISPADQALAQRLIARRPADPNQPYSYRDGNLLYATMPLLIDDALQGFVILVAGAHSAEVENAARIAVLLVSIVLAVVVAFIASLRARALTRPLVELTAAARKVDLEQPLALLNSLPKGTGVLGETLEQLLIAVQERSEAISRHERRFRQVFEASLAGLVVVDQAGVIRMANRAAHSIFAQGDQPLDGKRMDHLLPSLAGEPRANELLSGPEHRMNHSDVLGKRGDGSPITLQVGVSQMELVDGQATLAAIIDVSERARARQELERSNAELERYAAVVSHDLQEPVRVLLLYTQLLERSEKGRLSDGGQGQLDVIRKAAARMRSLISNLLSYSRVNSAPLMQRRLEPGALIEEIRGALADSLANAGARLEVESLPAIRADETLVRQVFQNLIGNALKFRREDSPHVRIRGRVAEDRVLFEVEDNGIGLEEKCADRVFEIFQRLQHADAYPGDGIGLSIVKRVIERHAGRITVRSRIGVGTVFTFDLPAA